MSDSYNVQQKKKIDIGIYKKMITTNDCSSKWNFNLVFIAKLDLV